MSLGNRICKFFKQLGNVKNLVVPSAVFRARKKIKYELYKRLNQDTVKMYYEKGNDYVKRFHGRLLWAVDSSSVNLPDSEETRAFYSKSTNKTSTSRIQGLASFLYDSLNEVIIDANLDEKKSEIDIALENHISHYTEEAIVIYNRGYGSYVLIATHASLKKDFIIRLRLSQTFSKVEQFIKSKKTDQIVTIDVPIGQNKIIKEKQLPESVKVRLIKLTLPTGETEILMTSLLDSQLYPQQNFLWIYNQRWGVETCINRLKNHLDLERFSSSFDLEIQQDFHAIVFISSLESIITKEDDHTVSSPKPSNKHQYKINKAISYAEVTDSIVYLLLQTDKSIESVFEEIRCILKMTPIAIRPDRSFPRNKLSPSDKLHFQKYRKKIFS